MGFLRSCATGILLFSGWATAFVPSVGVGMHSPSPDARMAPALANDFDVYWEKRRVRKVGEKPQQPQATAAGVLELNRDNVALVLTEFVQSTYARHVCNHHNVPPTDYGQIGGMFESVQIVKTTIVLQLKRAFDERNDALLERVTRYLRVKIPQISEIHVTHRDGLDIY
mmetsp:Transcript_10638/g.25562  ORF Transcript_10638/g.25562 Transcript_10638/m.25562 type:complete len:169 (+) Transcript_10638:122-628(+)